jgi:hypothetical protein
MATRVGGAVTCAIPASRPWPLPHLCDDLLMGHLVRRGSTWRRLASLVADRMYFGQQCRCPRSTYADKAKVEAKAFDAKAAREAFDLLQSLFMTA